ncbi:SagB-type dehydrogenase domain-containing protein [Balnearium lithotrophicum]|uniref:SagB-type dehydrogenase domain-containing protein n=1 Tax=Balnearium lithotrophicum TaxID=223788 RepID=A0A521AQ07_9BACT|nr:SagB/ThcOx family dehydrogenase [Balnearium lithotrophicum]SMO36892.1 SagB-type dehydrogenase domain-containing protein [Balnearium lithotrophicum]
MKDCYEYHIKTSHTYESVRRPHFLDWSNYPSPFKFYEGVRRFRLLPFIAVTQETIDTLYRICLQGAVESLSLQEISNLAFSMNGITKVENFHGETFGFRTTPSAGALYPFELYLFIRDLTEIPDGIYHYQPYDHTLELLSEGNYFESLQTALCTTVETNCVAVITAIYERSAWKYRDRAFRYCLLDIGHMVSNGVVYLKSVGLETTALSLFNDDSVNELLGVDGEREFSLCALIPEKPALFWGEESYPPEKFPETLPVLRKPVRSELIEKVYKLSKMDNCEFFRDIPESEGPFPEVSSLPISKVIKKRRSRRGFTGKFISFDEFRFIVESSLLCFPSDWGFPKCNFFIQVRNVNGVPDGVYTVVDGSLTLVERGNFGREMAYLCLGQSFVSRANMNVVFTYRFSDGNCRDYRGALIEAGALGENLYLSSESLNLGACGIGAFYDFELQRFLNLESNELPVYVVSVGSL